MGLRLARLDVCHLVCPARRDHWQLGYQQHRRLTKWCHWLLLLLSVRCGCAGTRCCVSAGVLRSTRDRDSHRCTFDCRNSTRRSRDSSRLTRPAPLTAHAVPRTCQSEPCCPWVGRIIIIIIIMKPHFCSSVSQCSYSASTLLWSRTPSASPTKTRTSSHQWYLFLASRF